MTPKLLTNEVYCWLRFTYMSISYFLCLELTSRKIQISVVKWLNNGKLRQDNYLFNFKKSSPFKFYATRLRAKIFLFEFSRAPLYLFLCVNTAERKIFCHSRPCNFATKLTLISSRSFAKRSLPFFWISRANCRKNLPSKQKCHVSVNSESCKNWL